MSGFKRQNRIIMVSGMQGCGKTMVMTALGFSEWVYHNKKIYSNYHVNYAYEPIVSYDDLDKMRDGLFLADELWRWLLSRRSMRKDNIAILCDIVENLRKRNMDMIFSTHHPMHIDPMVRRVTTNYMIPQIIPIHVIDRECLHEKAEKMGWNAEKENQVYCNLKEVLTQNPENYGILVRTYNEIDELMSTYQLNNLSFWGGLYDTREEIGKLKKEASESLEEHGIKLELEFHEYVKRFNVLAQHIPHSSKGWFHNFDEEVIVVNQDNKKYLFDCAGLYPKQDRIIKSGVECQVLLQQSRQHHGTPYITIKRNNTWYGIPIEQGSYFLSYTTHIRISKQLEKEMVLISKLLT